MESSEIDFLLDDIRKACELGEIEEVILLSEKLKNKNNLSENISNNDIDLILKEELKKIYFDDNRHWLNETQLDYNWESKNVVFSVELCIKAIKNTKYNSLK